MIFVWPVVQNSGNLHAAVSMLCLWPSLAKICLLMVFVSEVVNIHWTEHFALLFSWITKPSIVPGFGYRALWQQFSCCHELNCAHLRFSISIRYCTHQHVWQPCVVFLWRRAAEGRCCCWTCGESFLRCKVPLNVCESPCCLDSECRPAALPVGLNEAECAHEGWSTHQRTLDENLTVDVISPL